MYSTPPSQFWWRQPNPSGLVKNGEDNLVLRSWSRIPKPTHTTWNHDQSPALELGEVSPNGEDSPVLKKHHPKIDILPLQLSASNPFNVITLLFISPSNDLPTVVLSKYRFPLHLQLTLFNSVTMHVLLYNVIHNHISRKEVRHCTTSFSDRPINNFNP